MISKYGPLGMQVDDRYRTIPEALIVDMLIHGAYACEWESVAAAEGSKKALQAWTQMGLAFRRATNGERLFDPVEVHNFMKRAGLDGRDGFLAERYVPTGRRLVSE